MRSSEHWDANRASKPNRQGRACQRSEGRAMIKQMVTTRKDQPATGPVFTVQALVSLLVILGPRQVSGGVIELDCLATIGAGADTNGSLDFRIFDRTSSVS